MFILDGRPVFVPPTVSWVEPFLGRETLCHQSVERRLGFLERPALLRRQIGERLALLFERLLQVLRRHGNEKRLQLFAIDVRLADRTARRREKHLFHVCGVHERPHVCR